MILSYERREWRVSISLQRHLLKQLSVPAKTTWDNESGLDVSQRGCVKALLKSRGASTSVQDLRLDPAAEQKSGLWRHHIYKLHSEELMLYLAFIKWTEVMLDPNVQDEPKEDKLNFVSSTFKKLN
jgi:hypothetical protein